MWMWKRDINKGPNPPYQPSNTILLYYWSNIPYTVLLPGGPGGVVTLNEEETVKLFTKVNPDVLYGRCSAELAADQLTDSEIIQEALTRSQFESNKEEPGKKDTCAKLSSKKKSNR